MSRQPPNLRPAAIACIAAGLLAGACSPKYYVPNTHNVPLLREEGDCALLVATGDWRIEVQGAYALTSNGALMLNAASFHPEDDEKGDGAAWVRSAWDTIARCPDR